MVSKEVAAISYSITPLNHDAKVTFIPYLDGNVYNEDSNYNEIFWVETERRTENNYCCLSMKTKKLDFHVTAAMKYSILQNDSPMECEAELIDGSKFTGNKITL